MRILMTGMAGFIGYHLAENLVMQDDLVILGVDNLNDYYPVKLKVDRLNQLGIQYKSGSLNMEQSVLHTNLQFQFCDITDKRKLESIYGEFAPDMVIHLAAQAGVRYSLENPDAYIESNIMGFHNMINLTHKYKCRYFIYASSSSVYGNDLTPPYSEDMRVDKPISIYAATKKANELIAYTYTHLYGIQTIGLRFFTVYGAYGRPDMAYHSFVNAILNGQLIRVFNKGNLMRDFTYVDDVVESLNRLIRQLISGSYNGNKYEIYNVGNSTPVMLMDFIATIEDILKMKANVDFVEMQQGDVLATHADNSKLERSIHFSPSHSLHEGLMNFVRWFKMYYNVK